MTMTFKDHFSIQASAYAAARPTYPDALFAAIAAHVPSDARVWEPGCGSGQATRGLASCFAHVHATDASPSQLAHHWARDASHAGRVTLGVEPAECTALSDASIGLVAVAQALHWFDRDAFFSEYDRVLTPGGVLAAWGYADFDAPAGMDDAVATFRADIARHWPPDREWIDARYLPFAWPFDAIDAPSSLRLEVRWTFPQFIEYLRSMSATVRCRTASGVDPVDAHHAAFAAAWGALDAVRRIEWPLFLHLRRKPLGTI